MGVISLSFKALDREMRATEKGMNIRTMDMNEFL